MTRNCVDLSSQRRQSRNFAGEWTGVSIEDEVDRLIDERPGAELLHPRYDDPAVEVVEGIWRSGGTTVGYWSAARPDGVIVNTGMGFEAPHHRRVFAAAHPGPTPYIVTTQAHVDHVGGVGLVPRAGHAVRGPGRQPRLPGGRPPHPALPVLDGDDLVRPAARDHRRGLAAEDPGVPMDQDRPTPDVLFDERHSSSDR